ncbi:MAG: deoxyribose-phosphate aldolase [Acidobacteria bacterium]|nr:deoxyribose-phosphate aldolase [Acidobacteriota bacterium]
MKLVDQSPAHPTIERNPGMPLDLQWVRDVRINRSAVERRASALGTRRTVKKQWQAAWLIRAIQCMDLTTLSGDDTPGNVMRLCAKAKSPVRPDLLTDLGLGDTPIHTAAVCVYHNFIPVACKAVKGTPIQVAAVSTGFPAAHIPLEHKTQQIRDAVALGATEIDIVISRNLVLTGDWEGLYEEVKAYREACGEAHMKSILATGELATLRNIAKASLVCMMAGSDFIKTSTGKESENAILPVGLVMVRAIREYLHQTGYKVGFKPAGGIRAAKEALVWLSMMKEELGNEWCLPHLFRFGASSLLADIERQLEHNLTGRYSAYHRHPMA